MKKIILILVASAIALATLLTFNQWDIEIKNIDKISINQKEDLELLPDAVLKGKYICKSGIPIKTIIDKEINTEKVGIETVQYTASFLWLSKTVTQEIEIKDVTPPQIILTTNEEYAVEYGDEYVEEGFSAFDEVDGEITDKVQVIKNDGIILYTVVDNAGNIAEEIRKITYKDTKPPELTLIGEEKIEVERGKTYTDAGYVATDIKDGDITNKVKISGSVNTNKPGKYTLKYIVQDNAGNLAEKTRTVIVTGESVTTIYLTFDDGPSSYTNDLLDVLKKYDVKATFFVVGTSRTDVLKRIYDEGHKIGAHSMTHNYKEIYSSTENYFKDLQSIVDLIYNTTGYKTDIIRFPGGSSNTVSKQYCEGIMSILVKEVENLGYAYFDWNVSSGDAGGTKTTENVLNNIKNGIKNKSNAIVLQHDTKKFSIDAVEKIILWAQENGYEFDVLTKDYPICHHGTNN